MQYKPLYHLLDDTKPRWTLTPVITLIYIGRLDEWIIHWTPEINIAVIQSINQTHKLTLNPQRIVREKSVIDFIDILFSLTLEVSGSTNESVANEPQC